MLLSVLQLILLLYGITKGKQHILLTSYISEMEKITINHLGLHFGIYIEQLRIKSHLSLFPL